MQDDIIAQVRSLIESNIGDTPRLQRILEDLQNDMPLGEADLEYIKSFPDDAATNTETRPATEVGRDQDGGDKEGHPAEESRDAGQEAGGETWSAPSRKKAAIVASIIAAVVLAYVGLDVYSIGQLEFRPHSGSQYQISPTEIHIQADVCNPSFFPATFNKYEINAFYNSQIIETADIGGTTVSPKAMSTLDGVFALNAGAIFNLKQQNATFDPSLAKITTSVDAPIFGVIPFSVVKEYTAEQFQNVLKNGPPGSFSC